MAEWRSHQITFESDEKPPDCDTVLTLQLLTGKKSFSFEIFVHTRSSSLITARWLGKYVSDICQKSLSNDLLVNE